MMSVNLFCNRESFTVEIKKHEVDSKEFIVLNLTSGKSEYENKGEITLHSISRDRLVTLSNTITEFLLRNENTKGSDFKE